MPRRRALESIAPTVNLSKNPAVIGQKIPNLNQIFTYKREFLLVILFFSVCINVVLVITQSFNDHNHVKKELSELRLLIENKHLRQSAASELWDGQKNTVMNAAIGVQISRDNVPKRFSQMTTDKITEASDVSRVSNFISPAMGATQEASHKLVSAVDHTDFKTRTNSNYKIPPQFLPQDKAFSNAVQGLYRLNWLTSYPHSISTISSFGLQLCLDRSLNPNSTSVVSYQCHASDVRHESSPQAWSFSRDGLIFTTQPGSVWTEDADAPSKNSIVSRKRCIAFNPLASTNGELRDTTLPVLNGRLVLVDCHGTNLSKQSRVFYTWYYDAGKQQLVSTSYVGYEQIKKSRNASQYGVPVPLAISNGYCLTTIKDSRIIYRLAPCIDMEKQNWDVQRIVKQKKGDSEGGMGTSSPFELEDFGFNITRSIEIGSSRELPDHRDRMCLHRSGHTIAVEAKSTLKANLSITKNQNTFAKSDFVSRTATIIIVFQNEEWFALLRLIWGIYLASAQGLVEEILLVDNGSNVWHLHDLLAAYLKEMPMLNARVIRCSPPVTSSMAKMIGAAASHDLPGQVLVFLDSQVEVVKGWLHPLVEAIATDRRRVMLPRQFNMRRQDLFPVDPHGLFYTPHFDWDLNVMKSYRRWPYDGFAVGGDVPLDKSPIIEGTFAIDRKYFFEMGGYDELIDDDEITNLEMSLRIWLCGGQIMTHPCSQMYHIFNRLPGRYSDPNPKQLNLDKIRLALAWWEDYVDALLEGIPEQYLPSFVPDISARKKLKSQLQCVNFGWYVDQFMADFFIPGAAHNIGSGDVRNGGSQWCLDANKVGRDTAIKVIRPASLKCHGRGAAQNFMFTEAGEIRTRQGLCVDVYRDTQWTRSMKITAGQSQPLGIFLERCHGHGGNQQWVAVPIIDDTEKKAVLLEHPSSGGLCLESDRQHANGKKTLKMKPCDDSNQFQHWIWSSFK